MTDVTILAKREVDRLLVSFERHEQALIMLDQGFLLDGYPSLYDARLVDENGTYIVAGGRINELEQRSRKRLRQLALSSLSQDIISASKARVETLKAQKGNGSEVGKRDLYCEFITNIVEERSQIQLYPEKFPWRVCLTMNYEEVAQSIWTFVDRGEPFPWPRSPRSAVTLGQSLSSLLNDQGAVEVFKNEDKHKSNIDLRNLVSPYLKGEDRILSENLATWIVANWGGIRRGNEAIPGWAKSLNRYEKEDTDLFVHRMGAKRVSSWSKMLAFADPANHAIYDARTAVALNCALRSIGAEHRFVMSSSQNRRVSAARRKLLQEHGACGLGYREYIKLLKAMVSQCGLSDILVVEMALFSNAPLLAAELVG